MHMTNREVNGVSVVALEGRIGICRTGFHFPIRALIRSRMERSVNPILTGTLYVPVCC
jgi:hypothetical protein